MTQANPRSGTTTQLLTFSGKSSATALGASSPSTMWSTVMMEKAITTATEWVAKGRMPSGRKAKLPSIRRASAGSPIQPRPSDARVIPSWVAEI